jgi:2-iminobutanoate/2-iminopropanoate deaminase
MTRTTILMLVLGCWAGSAVLADLPDVEHLDSGKVLPEGLPFSEAVRVGNTLYLSGQIGVRPGTLDIVEGGMAAQARQTLENVKTTLEAHGYSMRDVVKCTVMLLDMSEWGAFNEIYTSYFSPPYPARSAFGTSGLAVGARLELECIAVVEPKAPGARRASAGDPR